MEKEITCTIIALLIVSACILALGIQPANASETIYIRADGSIEPPTAPISTTDNVTYTFQDNINDSIVVERDDVVIDGAGYALRGTWSGVNGMDLTGRTNVTIRNTHIGGFAYDVWLNSSSHNNIYGNWIVESSWGIGLYSSTDNNISGNSIINNGYSGISLDSSSHNNIIGNNISTTINHGIFLRGSSNYNNISENTITNGQYGIGIYYSSIHNSISRNNITDNGGGVWLNSLSDNNVISENNLTANRDYCIWLYYSSYNSITKNMIANNYIGVILSDNSTYNSINGNTISNSSYYGVDVYGSPSNNISENIVVGQEDGISLYLSANCSIRENIVVNNQYGVRLGASSDYCNISENSIVANEYGVDLYWSSSYSVISGNNITSNSCGVLVGYAFENKFYHNNLIANGQQVNLSSDAFGNVWDNGYPSGGNYWSDYSGADVFSGPDQDTPGSDGIGDTSYSIDSNNQDNYPLMTQYVSQHGAHDVAVTSVIPSETIVRNGFNVSIGFTVENHGDFAETFNVTAYVDTIVIDTFSNVMLTSKGYLTLDLDWNTSEFAGTYLLSLEVSSLQDEIDLSDNRLVYGLIKISCVGDANLDFVTDGKDFVLVKKAMGSSLGSPRWNSMADLNGDDAVDAQDYQTVKSHIPSRLP